MATTPGLQQANLLMEARQFLHHGQFEEARATLQRLETWPMDTPSQQLMYRLWKTPDESLESLLDELGRRLLPRPR